MSSSKVFISELSDNSSVETIFLVASKVVRETRNGDPYLCLTLQDRTGTIEGRAWDNALALEGRFEVDDFVALRGRVSSYRGELQLTVTDVEKISDDQVELDKFLPHSRWDGDDLFDKLQRLIAQEIASDEVRRFLDALFADEDRRRAYLQAPAAVSNHHAYLGGLIEHSLSMARLAVSMGRHYEAYYPGLVDTDLVVAGCILHDIGKIDELTYRRSFDYSTEGRLVGHIAGGCELVGRIAESLSPRLDKNLEMQLKHLVLSHHGKKEYGAPITPRSAEAMMLHQLDMVDSRMNMHWNASRDLLETEGSEQSWTDYERPLGGYVYVGNDEARRWRGDSPSPDLAQGPGLASTTADDESIVEVVEEPTNSARDGGAAAKPAEANLSLFGD